jgi:catechol 2,3-dioxygenase-like lactoylglutathione lyase family enzyme
MVTITGAFSGMSVRDVPEAVRFWRSLGLQDHEPAGFTVLNLVVPDVGVAIRELAALGLTPERYPGMPQDEDGAMRGNGPDIAWFTDPSGNVFSVLVD